MKRLKSGKLIVRPSKIHGYGVYAARGDLIEECTTIEIRDKPITAVLNKGIHHLSNYTHKINNGIHIALGNGSLYNHSNKPNAELVYSPHHDVIQIWALDSIMRGQEILVYYGNAWSKDNHHRIIQAKENATMLQTILRLPLAKTAIFVVIVTIALKLKLATM